MTEPPQDDTLQMVFDEDPGSPPDPPVSPPDLEFLELLGEGGMGTVWRCRQISLDREVAVKAVRADVVLQPAFRERFRREAQALARIEHPGVVPVHQIAEEAGKPYSVMRLVKGMQLGPWAASKSFKEIATCMRDVALAIDHCHARGVLHRDIKPSNVLVEAEDKPIVVDFGLARFHQGEAADLSQSGSVIGTPDYLSPEAARGEEQTPRSDVYGLGATLYLLLCGQPPFPRGSLATKLHRIQHTVPELPRRLRREVPEPLQAICLQAMERDPEDRYPTARELAKDLARFLTGQPVKARPSALGMELERRTRAHVRALEEWNRDGLISDRDFIQLRDGYEDIASSPHESILESGRLSAGMALLYMGVLIAVLSTGLALTLAWDPIAELGRFASSATRFLLVVVPLLAAALIGRHRHRHAQDPRALPLLFGATLLIPAFTFLVLHEIPGLREVTFADYSGTDQTRELRLLEFDPGAGSQRGGSRPLQSAMDLKMLFVAASLLIAGWGARRILRAPVFTWPIVLGSFAFAWLLAVNWFGWRDWSPAGRAAWFVPLAAATMAAGVARDLQGSKADARPFYILGFLALGVAWAAMQSEGQPLEWLGVPNSYHSEELSLVLGGVFAIAIALAGERIATPMLTRYAIVPWLVAGSAVLYPLTDLGEEGITTFEIVAPLACAAFVALSVMRQRRNLFFSGATWLSINVFIITENHFERAWAWPFTILTLGTILAVAAWHLIAHEQRR